MGAGVGSGLLAVLGSAAGSGRWSRFRSRALAATITLEPDIEIAAISGLSMIPRDGKKMPAAGAADYAWSEFLRTRSRINRYPIPAARTISPMTIEMRGRVTTRTRQPIAPRIWMVLG